MYLSPHEEQKSPRSLRCNEGCWEEGDQAEGVRGGAGPAEGAVRCQATGARTLLPSLRFLSTECVTLGTTKGGVSGHPGFTTRPFTRGAVRLCSPQPNYSRDTSGFSLSSTDLWLHDSKTRPQEREEYHFSYQSKGIRVTAACGA